MEEKSEDFGETNNIGINQDDKSNLKDHAEIIKLINNIKKFEKKIPEFDVPEDEIIEEDNSKVSQIRFQEVNEDIQQDDTSINDKPEINEKPKLKLRPKSKIQKQEFNEIEEIEEDIPQVEFEEVPQRSIPSFRKPSREVKPATFKIRFNEEGNLENIDLKKKDIKKPDFKFIKKLKIDKVLKIIKKEKSEDNKENKESEKSGKLSKITNIFGKVKGVTKILDKLPIPKRGSKSSKDQDEKKEE